MTLQLYVGNTSPSLSDTITSGGDPVDLTGATVTFQMRERGSSTLVVDTPATIVDAAAGTVRYDWAAGDVDTAGEYVAWWRVTLPGGRVQDGDEFPLNIDEHGPVSSVALCTLEDVRALAQLRAEFTVRDEEIEDLIIRASTVIMRRYEREFAPAVSGVTRRFRISDHRVDLAPYDLRSVTSISLHPESASPVTLTTDDYTLEPDGGVDGTYNSVDLSDYLSSLYDSDTLRRYGFARIDITGAWGFARVPDDVRHATAVTVASWLRRDIAPYVIGQTEPGEESPGAVGTFSLPPDAMRILAPYRRFVL